MESVTLPLLSESDPALRSEGSIEPLGLYAIADALAVRLVPGVRERQIHPRFLTTTAVSLQVCSEFDEDEVAADGVSPPWIVFEWHVVEGLVRQADQGLDLRGLPGHNKVQRAIADGVPLGASRYLKTASVYGFHGVYRLLARTLGVEAGERLGEAGWNLLQRWQVEQGLGGFTGSAGGPGAEWLAKLRDAVRDGMRRGVVARSGGWSGWRFMRKHLAHLAVGVMEAAALARLLQQAGDGYRADVLDFLVSREGRDAFGMDEEQPSERSFHEALIRQATNGLRGLLETVQAYEAFSRLLQDAFEDALFEMSRCARFVTPEQLAKLPSLKAAAEGLPPLFEQLEQRLAAFGQSALLGEIFANVCAAHTARDMAYALLEHHVQVQRRKPPHGKRPWFDRRDDKSCCIRPGYEREQGGKHDRSYVNAYRTFPLMSFATDLGLLK